VEGFQDNADGGGGFEHFQENVEGELVFRIVFVSDVVAASTTDCWLFS
jgi:hypothetical protein